MSDRISLALDRLKDPRFYLESFCWIKTKSAGLQPFILKNAQLDFFNALRKFKRLIILKSRQMGFSTAAAGWIFHKVITTPGINAVIVSYDSEQAEEILDKMKVFLDHLPDELRPTVKYNSRHELYFPKLSSRILVIAAKDTAGRGFCINLAHLSEVAFWDSAEEKMAAILAGVPDDGVVIVESTPNMVGDYFHRLWTAEDDIWCRKAYGWWWEYTEAQIERKRREYNDPERYAREFLMKFGATGRTVFEQDLVERERKHIWKVGGKYDVGDGEIVVPEVIDGLTIYRKPVAGRFYVAGADVAEGIGQEGDFSVAVFFDRQTGEEVAHFRGKLPPDRFGERLNDWGRYYNNALMVPEVNNHGLTTLTILKQKCYPNLYFRPAAYDKSGIPMSDRVGWRTTVLTKPLMIDDLGKMFRDGLIRIHSARTLDEMLTFVYDDRGHMNAMDGMTDDSLIATCVALQGFKVSSSVTPEQIDYRQHIPVGGY